MSFGNHGGQVTQLVLTCRTPESGAVAIARGDALALAGSYRVTNDADAGDPVFGVALGDASSNNAVLPVLVRGVALFAYTGDAPAPGGGVGVVFSALPGVVAAPVSGSGAGQVVSVNPAAHTVEVLL